MVQALPRGRNPFDDSGVERDAQGIARYVERPASLVAMLARERRARRARAPRSSRSAGRRSPTASCGSAPRASPAACTSGGVQRGDRVAIRLANGIDWVLAFFGTQMLGAVIVPVNTRFTQDEVAYVVEDSGAKYTFEPGAALPDGHRASSEDLAPRTSRRSSTRAARPASRRGR